VPGNDLCAEFYLPLAHALAARGVSTTLATLPGVGGLPGFGEPTWAAYVAEVRRAVTETTGRGGVLIGHSLGGLVAFLALAAEPGLARRLILLEPFILPLRLMARGAARVYRAHVIDGQGERFTNWTGSFRRVHRLDRFPEDAVALYEETRRTTVPGTVTALFEQLEGLYPLPFAEVRAPTRILRGAHSGWRNAAIHWLLCWRLPNASQRILPTMAHWMANEDDAALSRAIAEFAVLD
jgi:pimeloyl-ACP methyl ester carboxylesterase